MVLRILAWDYSGSTGRCGHSHTIGKKYVNEFRAGLANDTKEKCLLWDHECVEVDAKRLDQVIETQDGNGCTYPSKIIEWIQKHVKPEDAERIELWLITDGEIDSGELKKCARLNQTMTYDLVRFIIINTQKIDMSVGASFISGSAVEIYINDAKFKTVNTSLPFDYNSITNQNFDERWPELTDFIQAKFMGSDRDALEETVKLGSLRKRLLADLAKTEAENHKGTPIAKFQSKKKADLIKDLKECQFYKLITNANLKDARTRIDGMVSSLVNYIHNDHKSYDFNVEKMDFKTERMVTAEEEPEIDTLVNVEQCKFYDCVTLENEMAQPILVLPITDLISKYWENGSYSKFRAIVDCPLFASIDACIGHVYSLETFKSLRDHAENSEHNLVNPMTNEPIFGGLIFSTTAEADCWNDYVLAHTLFRGKKVCADFSLWYFVIWKHCQNKKWIEAEVVKKLRDYAFRRLESSIVRLALSSLPLDPQELVPVAVACFYCTEGSSILFGEDNNLFAHERLRMYSSVADQMLEILEYFGYVDIDVEFVIRRAKALRVINELKRIPQLFEKRYTLARKVFQASEDPRFLTYEVKNWEALKYFHLLKYSHKEMIPFNFDAGPLDLKDHLLLAYKYKELYEVKVCEATYRPYFVVYDENSGKKVPNYKQILECVRNVELEPKTGNLEFRKNVKHLNQSRLLSYYKLYIGLTAELKRFPTLEEFKDYVAKVRRFKEQRLVFLFQPTAVKDCENIFKIYEELNPRLDEFLQKSMATVSIETRVKAEKRLGSKPEKFISQAKELLECS